MKILDKYVAKSFLTGYFISLAVLMGLRILIDLLLNIDEFTEAQGLWTIAYNMLIYYWRQSSLYFRDFAGIITVLAAAFSLGKMTRNNELIAVMASGVSLKRVIAPIVFLALCLTGFLVVDQEFVIPSLADKLVRSQDASLDKLSYDAWFLSDSKGSLFCAPGFSVKDERLKRPTIIVRTFNSGSDKWEVTGIISADSATYNEQTQSWDLNNGIFTNVSVEPDRMFLDPVPDTRLSSYKSDLKPRDIPIRRKSKYIGLLGLGDLVKLAKQNPKDLATLYSHKNFRITDPVINMIMLLVSLPVLICRDPRTMKTAILKSFSITIACFITVFACKMIATEAMFDRVLPQLWAWVPIFIFAPIAFIELDSMKT